MKAQVGAVVRLYYDSPSLIDVGDALRTTTGRGYLILELRRQAKGLHVGRWHIVAQVIDEDDLKKVKKVHPIFWYRR